MCPALFGVSDEDKLATMKNGWEYPCKYILINLPIFKNENCAVIAEITIAEMAVFCGETALICTVLFNISGEDKGRHTTKRAYNMKNKSFLVILTIFKN